MLLEDVFWPVTFPQRRTGCWGGSAAEPSLNCHLWERTEQEICTCVQVTSTVPQGTPSPLVKASAPGEIVTETPKPEKQNQLHF